jgi:hypothetical protein
MVKRRFARSISRSIQAAFRSPVGSAWQVLGAFERACDLVAPDGGVISLVLAEIGNGPLNVVLDGTNGDFATIRPGMPAWFSESELRVGELQVGLDGAVLWEPRPDWEKLEAHRAVIADQLPLLRALALRQAPPNSLLCLFHSFPYDKFTGASKVTFTALVSAAAQLRSGWQGDNSKLHSGVTRLAGLGNGLTPSGDDFLAGVMLWAWLAHAAREPFCHSLLEAAAPRTTTLSAALLRSAASGECSAPWHRLLEALADSDQGQWLAATDDIMSLGNTSGADTLAGFLWIALGRA